MRALIGESPRRCFGYVLLATVVMAGMVGDFRFGGAIAEEVRLEVGRVHRGEALSGAQRGRRAAVPEDGLIAGFEDGAVSASFGVGWAMNTDATAGGRSTAEMAAVDGGAADTSMSMRVTGKIVLGPGPVAWAGPVFFPGRQPYGASDMSAHEGISFWARGDGQSVSVVVFARSLPEEPASVLVPTTDVWVEHRLAFADFAGLNPKGLTAILFSGNEPGDFEFQIDELRVH